MKIVLFALALSATAALADEAAPAAKPAAAKPAAARKAKTGTEINSADLKWSEMKDSGGIMMAPLTGDASKGAFTAMVKFPAGMMQPQHTHTANIKVVVISGTLMGGPDTASAKEYGPGSFRDVPSGWKHVTGCKAGAECLVFVEGSGKMDQKPVEEAKK